MISSYFSTLHHVVRSIPQYDRTILELSPRNLLFTREITVFSVKYFPNHLVATLAKYKHLVKTLTSELEDISLKIGVIFLKQVGFAVIIRTKFNQIGKWTSPLDLPLKNSENSCATLGVV